MNIFSLSTLFFGFGTLLTGFVVYFKRQDEVARKWLLFSIAAATWGLFYAPMVSNLFDKETSLMCQKIHNTGSIFISPTWLDFIFTLLGIRDQKKRLLDAVYILAFLISSTVLTPYFLKDPIAIAATRYYTQPGFTFHFFTAMFFICVSYGFVKVILAYRIASGGWKTQLKCLIWATGIGFTGGSFSFAPVYGIDLPQYNLLVMPLYPFLMVYALTRHRLFDLEQLAQAVHRDKLAAIGILATSINHEIRNPLYVIKGLAESHLANVKDDVYKDREELVRRSNEILSKAVDQAQRAMEIMKRFSLFAKQSTQNTVHFEEVDLAQTFEGVLPLVRHEMELDKIELAKEIPEDLPRIRADKRCLEEILFNLIVNACQAMKSGGKLTLRAEQRNGTVQVEIQDNGPGIPPDQLSKIFEPFYTTKESGTGLGLYITKQLVERNRGSIQVVSKTDEGTLFILKFPLAKNYQ